MCGIYMSNGHGRTLHLQMRTKRDVAAMTIGTLQARRNNRRFPRCAEADFGSTVFLPVLTRPLKICENTPNAIRAFDSILSLM